MICDQAEECVDENQKCATKSFSRETVVEDLKALKSSLSNIVAPLIEKTEKRQNSLMERELCKDNSFWCDYD